MQQLMLCLKAPYTVAAIIVLVCLQGPAALAGVAADAESQSPDAIIGCGIPECGHCGSFLVGCSTRVNAEISVDGIQDQHVFASPACLQESLETWGERAVLISFKVLDFGTFGGNNETMLDGETAFYLVGTEAELPGSLPSHIAAFANDADATEAAADLGGTLVEGWDALVAALLEARRQERATNEDSAA